MRVQIRRSDDGFHSLGPFEEVSLSMPNADDEDSSFTISGDGDVIAYSDNVNPGLWIRGGLFDNIDSILIRKADHEPVGAD